MRKIVIRAVLLLGPLLVAAAILHARAQQVPQQGAAPASFVPFSAHSLITTATGAEIVGRYYRRSDGSTRAETGERPGMPSLVLINNYATRVTYSWRARDDDWVSHPMETPPPQPWVPDENSLASMRPVPEAVEGFELLRKDNPGSGGGYSLVAPRLNYYPLVIRSCADDHTPPGGCVSSRKHRIEIGEPPSELFEPGAGETPVRSGTPFARQPVPR